MDGFQILDHRSGQREFVTAKLDLQPTLKGQWVTLRPLLRSDFEALYAAASDPLIWEQHPEPNRYQRPVFETYFNSGIECRGAFAILDSKTGKIIGSTRFYSHDTELKEVVIGYTFIERAYWGKKHNPEMKKMLLEHAFQKADRVLFYIGEKNTRSRKAIESIGAVLIDRSERTLPDGSPHVDVIYKIDKSDYRSPL